MDKRGKIGVFLPAEDFNTQVSHLPPREGQEEIQHFPRARLPFIQDFFGVPVSLGGFFLVNADPKEFLDTGNE